MANFFKSKISKGVLAFSLSAVAVGGIVAGAIAYKVENPAKPVFLNYNAYAGESNVDAMRNNFDYRTYSDVNDFKDQLANGKIAGGITTGYQIYSMVVEGLVQPINYDAFFGFEGSDAKGKAYYDETWAEGEFTSNVYEQLIFFDKFFEDEEVKAMLQEKYGADQPLHIWNFMVPYYNQEKVLLYDWNDVDQSNTSLTDEEKQNQEIDIDTRIANHATLTDTQKANGRDFYNLFTVIREVMKSSTVYAIHDEMRDDISYGSMNVVNQDVENFDGQLKSSTYKGYIDNFINGVTGGANLSLTDTEKLIFSTDSNPLLNNLINPDLNYGVAVIYNGDGVDAFFAEDNFESYYSNADNFSTGNKSQNPVRKVSTKAQITLTDGFIISSNLTQSEADSVAKNVHDNMYDGWFNEDYATLPDGLKGNYVKRGETESTAMYDDKEESFSLQGFINFDFVNYTPPTKVTYNLVFYNNVSGPSEDIKNYTDNLVEYYAKVFENNYFYDGLIDEFADSDGNVPADSLDQFNNIVRLGSQIGLVEWGSWNKNPAFNYPASDVVVAAAQVYLINKLRS